MVGMAAISDEDVLGVLGDLEFFEHLEEFFLEGFAVVVLFLVADVVDDVVVGGFAHGEGGVAVLPAEGLVEGLADPGGGVAFDGGNELGDGEGWGEGAVEVDVVLDAADDEGFGVEVFEDALHVVVEARLPFFLDEGFAILGGPDEVEAGGEEGHLVLPAIWMFEE